MTIDNREDYIKQRLQRAEKSYQDALILTENQRWNAVVNMSYYACFYAVIALLLQNNIKTLSHDGTRTQFGLHFIKTGLIDKKFGKLYSKLFYFKQKGDYGDLYDYDGLTISPLISLVREFINVIKQFIQIYTTKYLTYSNPFCVYSRTRKSHLQGAILKRLMYGLLPPPIRTWKNCVKEANSDGICISG